MNRRLPLLREPRAISEEDPETDLGTLGASERTCTVAAFADIRIRPGEDRGVRRCDPEAVRRFVRSECGGQERRRRPERVDVDEFVRCGRKVGGEIAYDDTGVDLIPPEVLAHEYRRHGGPIVERQSRDGRLQG